MDSACKIIFIYEKKKKKIFENFLSPKSPIIAIFEGLPMGKMKFLGFSAGGFWGWGSHWWGQWVVSEVGNRCYLSKSWT